MREVEMASFLRPPKYQDVIEFIRGDLSVVNTGQRRKEANDHTIETMSVKSFLKEGNTERNSVKMFLSDTKSGLKNVKNFLKCGKLLQAESTIVTKRFLGLPTHPEVEEIDRIIRSGLSESTRRRLMRKNLTGDTQSESIASIVSSWLVTNWRPILWAVGWSAAVTLGITLAYVYMAAGSWMMFLQALSSAGIRIVPGAIVSALKSAGISTAANLTIGGLIKGAKRDRRIRRVLEKRIPTSYLGPMLERVGIDTENITTETMITTALNQLASIATSNGLNSYLLSSSLSYAPTAAMKGAKGVYSSSKAGVKASATSIMAINKHITGLISVGDMVKEQVESDILNSESTTAKAMVNIQDVIEKTAPTPRRKRRRRALQPIEQVPTKQQGSIERTIVNNKAVALATASSTALLALATGGAVMAATGDTAALTESLSSLLSPASSSELSKIAIKYGNIAFESSMARAAVSRVILEGIGINALIGKLSKLIGPKRVRQMRSLAEAIREEKNESKLTKLYNKLFITMLVSYYQPSKLKKMNKKELVRIAKESLSPGDLRKTRTLDKTDLIRYIINQQSARLNVINNLLTGALSQVLTAASAALISEGLYEGYKYSNATLPEVQTALNDLKNEKARQTTQGPQLIDSKSKIIAEKSPHKALSIKRQAEIKSVIEKAKERIKIANESKLKEKATVEDVERTDRKQRIASMRRNRAIAKLRKTKDAFLNDLSIEELMNTSNLDEIQNKRDQLQSILNEAEALDLKTSALNELSKSLENLEKGLNERLVSMEATRRERLDKRSGKRQSAEEFKQKRRIRREEAKRLKKERFEEAKARRLKSVEQRVTDQDITFRERQVREHDTIIIGPESKGGIPLPGDDHIIPPPLQEALDKLTITHLSQLLIKETAKASMDWVPGIGIYQSAVSKAQLALGTAKAATQAASVVSVLVQMQQETEYKDINTDTLDKLTSWFGSAREATETLPTTGNVIDRMIQTDTINAKEMVLKRLKDKIVYGWDNTQLAIEIGRDIVGRASEDLNVNPIDIPTDAYESMGSYMWRSIFE